MKLLPFAGNPSVSHAAASSPYTGEPVGRGKKDTPAGVSFGVWGGYLPQHFLYFRPLPQGQGSLRPGFFLSAFMGIFLTVPSSPVARGLRVCSRLISTWGRGRMVSSILTVFSLMPSII